MVTESPSLAWPMTTQWLLTNMNKHLTCIYT